MIWGYHYFWKHPNKTFHRTEFQQEFFDVQKAIATLAHGCRVYCVHCPPFRPRKEWYQSKLWSHPRRLECNCDCDEWDHLLHKWYSPRLCQKQLLNCRQGNLIVAIVKCMIYAISCSILIESLKHYTVDCLIPSEVHTCLYFIIQIFSNMVLENNIKGWHISLKPQSQQNRVSEFSMCDCVGAKHGTSMAICPVLTPRSMGTRLWLRSFTSWRMTSVHSPPVSPRNSFF